MLFLFIYWSYHLLLCPLIHLFTSLLTFYFCSNINLSTSLLNNFSTWNFSFIYCFCPFIDSIIYLFVYWFLFLLFFYKHSTCIISWILLMYFLNYFSILIHLHPLSLIFICFLIFSLITLSIDSFVHIFLNMLPLFPHPFVNILIK